MKVTMKRIRMLGTASSFNDSSGANADPSPFFGGVRGSVQAKRRQQRTRRCPTTRNVLVSAASMAGPVLGVPSALPSQDTTPAGFRDRWAPWPSRSG